MPAKLYAVLVAGAFAAIAAGVYTANQPEHAHYEADSSLAVSTRESLRVCLDTYGSVDGKELGQLLSSGLDEVRRHPHWDTARYGDRAPALEEGCTTSLPDGAITKGITIGPGVTDDPSPYRTVIVVLDEAHAQRHLGDQPAVLVPYEQMRVRERVTVTVTQAVVVREGFVGEPAFAEEYLAPALGLEPTARQG